MGSTSRWPHRGHSNRKHRQGASISLDLYGRDALLNPQQTYRRIREAGAAVWLPRHRMWAMGRYRDVHAALGDDDGFRSGRGVAANWLTNKMSKGTTVASDGEAHTVRRRVLLQSLSAKALTAVEPILQQEASVLIPSLIARETFDGVMDFASHLPIQVVAGLVGVDIDSARMLKWAKSGFDGLGAVNRRMLTALPRTISFWRYVRSIKPEDVKVGSWAASLLAGGHDNELRPQQRQALVVGIIGPSLDTTILASAQLLWSLGNDPAALQELRRNPELIPAAAVEAVRLASPVRGFTRTVQRDIEVDGSVLRAGDRVVLLYASANMDETQFEHPEVFSLHRRGVHLGWGFGAHACAGMHLSKLEMHALLHAMIPAVSHIAVSEPVRLVNNTVQGFASFNATFRG